MPDREESLALDRGPAPNMNEEELYTGIVGDFEDAWDSMAANPAEIRGGNFMFGRQAMTLLEFASRLAAEDSTGAALWDLSAAMVTRERKYFTLLPWPCADPGEFSLPSAPNGQPQCQLLWALFDLIRNGGAHQYQSANVTLTDDTFFGVSTTGRVPGYFLRDALTDRTKYLGFLHRFGEREDILNILVQPEILFLDIKAAIHQSGLLNRGLRFRHIMRPMQQPPSRRQLRGGAFYKFDRRHALAALNNGGHAALGIELDDRCPTGPARP